MAGEGTADYDAVKVVVRVWVESFGFGGRGQGGAGVDCVDGCV